ncbi:cytochrome P450 [Nodosilinea sp. LEGE 07088]|uniref:cytochrome P450 n=1 Tax=Nodosilinea sp. LEGE 07088 TaxID=2777968 RepID=UPI00187E8A5A|nr:cytochrome P450 [Nodosilinea sp. LEGE 07088]MBE9135663.1 cytochrome P450 [Nodosilinea sp. LEGE 07088]
MQAKSQRIVPPGPKGIPFVGVLFDYIKDPLGFSQRCAQEFGEVVLLPLGPIKVYLLTNPEHIHEVFSHQNDCFIKGVSVRSLKSSLGKGLLTSEGDFWQRHRRLMQPAFHRERVSEYGEIIVNQTESMIGHWQDGSTRDIHDDMMKLTLLIVAQSLFGADIADKTPIIESALDAILIHFSNQLSTLFLLPEWIPTLGKLRFWRQLRQMDKAIYEIIHQRRETQQENRDLLTMLLQAKDESGEQMSNKEIRDEVATLIMAGHETTALTLTWTWMLLGQNPQVELKLVEEIQAVLKGRSPTVNDIAQLHYANWIIKESMRLYPPAWGTSRQVVKSLQIGGYVLKPGVTVFLSQWLMHRDSRFFEHPEQFCPERWADGLEHHLPKGVYFPFGEGPRTCIGKGFALMESVLILVAIAQRFHLSLHSNYSIELNPSITLRPKHGLKICLQERHRLTDVK